MRYSIRACLILLLVLAITPATLAQQRQRVYVDNVQIGFAAGADSADAADLDQGRASLHKSGFWTPVYVVIRAGQEGLRGGLVIVETTDSDDVQNTFTVSFPPLNPDDRFLALTYTKPGSQDGEMILTIKEQVGESRFKPVLEQKKNFRSILAGDILCLAVGSRMPGMRQIVPTLFGDPNKVTDRLRVAYADEVALLPNRWFGYAPIDLMVLTTGKREFVNGLKNDDKKREALAEWVRRGGHLVVSCGRNQDSIEDLFNQARMPLPVKTSELNVQTVEGLRNWMPVGTPPLQGQAGGKIIMAKLERKPGAFLEPIVPDRESDPSPPLLVRWPYGMGQITLVAFDLDEAPFTTWAGQKEFWRKLITKMGLRPPDSKPEDNKNNFAYGGDGKSDLATMLQVNLENFKDVSVISFGWVALFILVYIIIVGPLDYLFLKKVVKRLELTWITFPAVVLAVSAAAYFAAYHLKGNDLRVNKVDLIDIDLENRRSFGTTWFTVFSPRIQLYTVGVEPAAPLWTPETEGAAPKPAPVVVSWMGRPEDGYGGYNRARSQSLFRRTYEYDADAAGLHGVPIQVWSTKTFTANWEGGWQSSQPASSLRRRENPRELEGSVTNPLSVALDDAALIYGESSTSTKVYRLGKLEPGQSKMIIAGKDFQNMAQWLGTLPTVNTGRYNAPPTTVEERPLLKRIMFFEAAGNPDKVRDSALRYLDQSWRQTHPNVAILYGRVAQQEGPAETVTRAAATPSRLWLGRLPSAGGARPKLDGVLVQDTYVRVYIPVPPATPKDEG